jgi:hypothetical protein
MGEAANRAAAIGSAIQPDADLREARARCGIDWRRMTCLLVVLMIAGCTRAFYRRSADRETYATIGQHADENRWPIASPGIIPPPESRLFDPYNPDRPPMPPDDPAADAFMVRPNGIRGSRHFHDDGDAPFIESPEWLARLALNQDGSLGLTEDRAVQLGILNARSYQTALETLYLNALGLTLNRFFFDCQFFLTNNTTWSDFGASATNIDTINTASTFGFTRNLYAGGQFMAEIANNFLVTFSGIDKTIATTNLMAAFTQPLLQGGGRRFALEPLTEAERSLLYAVRDFARFRKVFYVNLTTGNSGYLPLLQQVQGGAQSRGRPETTGTEPAHARGAVRSSKRLDRASRSSAAELFAKQAGAHSSTDFAGNVAGQLQIHPGLATAFAGSAGRFVAEAISTGSAGTREASG